MKVLLTASLVLLVLGSTTAHQWQHHVLYNSQVNLTCRDHDFWPENFTDVKYQWVLPSGEVINPYSSLAIDQLSFMDNGSVLVVSDVERHNFGIYLCLALVPPFPGVHVAVKQGINVDGPYFGDLSEKYLPQAKIGMFAGLFIFAFMSMLCWNYDQFQERHDKPADESTATPKSALHMYLGTPLNNAASFGEGEMNHQSFEETMEVENVKAKNRMEIQGETNPAFDDSDLPKPVELKTQF